MGVSELIQGITLVSVVVVIITNTTSLISKRESKAASDARIEGKIDNIIAKMEGMERRQTTQECTLQTHGERITAVEESAKQAHLRINRWEGGGSK